MKQLLSILALVTLLFMTQSCSKEMANKAKPSTASDVSNAATTSHVTYTINKQWKLLNFCDGELVDLSGIAKFDIQTVRNNNTSKLIGTGVFSNLTGVEPNTGKKWV